ncbi:MAG: transposase [Xanthobacteraceae bacterium]|nr:transposase [Xanthobacteraceae bacterium]
MTGDHTLTPEAVTARRLEETLVPGAVVSEVARRHGLALQQLFTWRRDVRQPAGADAATEAPYASDQDPG